ncbi:hypothetical protein LOTGIDRAFT_156172 [Lottia gigantea]|uniref:Uncharacterized protein n=1 Tax=Lottia gigantea TaxID=225164 RepID=V4BBK0_LOTGI|nr:hypothetical protein LOTGIDRAFT_156172 [Lottia gigantea]ESP04931.1 hypothetical protein LOTGIDRAFT_156172 [Lottia gigantea]
MDLADVSSKLGQITLICTIYMDFGDGNTDSIDVHHSFAQSNVCDSYNTTKIPLNSYDMKADGRRSSLGADGRRCSLGADGRRSSLGADGRMSSLGADGRRCSLGADGRRGSLGAGCRRRDHVVEGVLWVLLLALYLNFNSFKLCRIERGIDSSREHISTIEDEPKFHIWYHAYYKKA